MDRHVFGKNPFKYQPFNSILGGGLTVLYMGIKSLI